jgi:8-oxo-dGTP diphosphatase
MPATNTVPAKLVTAAILRRGSEVLIARRGPQMSLTGMWEFAGGKVEKGETPEECLQRELREELSIEVEVGSLICFSDYTYDHGSFRILAYESRILAGQPTPSEHDKLAWVHACELLSYELLPADIPIAKRLASQIT